jgi:hypothetical protein
MSTPVFSSVLCLGFMGGTEKVSQLINRPVMSLFGTRMSGTSTEMVCHRIQLKLPVTTRFYRFLSHDRDLDAHGYVQDSGCLL